MLLGHTVDVCRKKSDHRVSFDTGCTEGVQGVCLIFHDLWLRVLDMICSPRDLARSWRSCTHPEGVLYFCDTRRVGTRAVLPLGTSAFTQLYSQRVYTDIDLRRQKNFDAVEKCILELTEGAKRYGISFPDRNCELVLDIQKTRQKRFCRYYFVDSERKLLFWVHDWTPREVYDNLKGVKEQTHISTFERFLLTMLPV